MSKRKDSTAWLSMLREELALIGPGDMIEPEGSPNEEHETVHGIANAEVRRLWTYYCTTEERATRMMIDANYERKDRDRQKLLRIESIQLKVKAETAKNILWVSLRDQFGLWDQKLGVGIREDWQVVSFDSSDNFIRDILKGML